jgi:hypothetical protein
MGSSTFLIEYTALQRITGDASALFLVALKQTLNDANMILNEAYDWPWMEVRSATNLRAAYTTGTITLVDSATDYVTTTGTWSTGWSPMRLRTAAGHDYLLTYNAGNSRWELDRDMVELETAVVYTLYQDTYTLPARLRSLYMGWSTEITEYPCSLISGPEMQAFRSGPFFTSTPVSRIALVEPDSTTLISQMMVFPVPSVVGTVHWRGYKEVAALTVDGDTFQFPLHVLPVFRRLARSMALELKGATDRANNERAQYEIDLQRLISKSAPTAGAQDSVRLSESHFYPKPPVPGSYGYDDGGYY